MATLSTKLQLTVASGALTSDAVNISLSKNLTVTGNLSGVIKVTATSAGVLLALYIQQMTLQLLLTYFFIIRILLLQILFLYTMIQAQEIL